MASEQKEFTENTVVIQLNYQGKEYSLGYRLVGNLENDFKGIQALANTARYTLRGLTDTGELPELPARF